MPFAWSPAALDDLHRLYVRQRLSAAETARAMGAGVTRNAVLGKVQRLGWMRTEPPKAGRPPSERPRLGRRKKPRRLPFARVLPLPELREITVASTPKPWTERGERECAFPVGEPQAPGGQLSCCARIRGRGDYCRAHTALMRMEGTALTPDEIEGIMFIARRAG
jgi:GcrA cell cycle regulator